MKFILLFFLMYPGLLIGQMIKSEKLAANELPAGIKFRGKLHEAWKWKDKKGENLLITSVLGPYYDTIHGLNEEDRTTELFVYHYLHTNKAWVQLWRMNDIERACGLDMTAEFIKNAITITDLDKDSIAETKVQYALGCAGDVSPPNMKLIMHEDTVKFALRGLMWSYGYNAPGKFEVTEKDVNLETFKGYKGLYEDYSTAQGRYQSEKEIKGLPNSFLLFARKEWLKFAEHKFPE